MAPSAAPSSPTAAAATASANLSTSSSSSLGNSVQKYLTNCKSLYTCIYCRTHLANHDELVSRSFQGNHGRAYLFNSVINISCGPAIQRELNTGSHAVADIFCANCKTTLGWKYEKAYVETQKYKEGKFIIELAHVVRENRHLELDRGEILLFGRLHACNNNGGYTSSSVNESNNSYTIKSNQHQSSLTPPSLGKWSSPVSSTSNEEVDDDEELMFPFYEDLCAGRSSYPSNYSWTHHNKMRRSLYLDSTPYDWKQSSPEATTSTSFSNSSALQQTCQQPGAVAEAKSNNLTSSLESSSDLSPSSPSSASTSASSSCHSPGQQQQRQKPNFGASNNSDFSNRRVSERYVDDDDYETQFKFEADKPTAINELCVGGKSEQQNCGLQDSGLKGANGNDLSGGIKQTTNKEVNDIELPSSSIACSSQEDTTTSSNGSEGAKSISLDDDEFYDCFTDHDISNPMVQSDSNSTLRIDNNNNSNND